jgi:hypothetical protein
MPLQGWQLHTCVSQEKGRAGSALLLPVVPPEGLQGGWCTLGVGEGRGVLCAGKKPCAVALQGAGAVLFDQWTWQLLHRRCWGRGTHSRWGEVG